MKNESTWCLRNLSDHPDYAGKTQIKYFESKKFCSSQKNKKSEWKGPFDAQPCFSKMHVLGDDQYYIVPNKAKLYT